MTASRIIPLIDYPVRPKRQPGESFIGYVYRYLSTNGYEFRVKHHELVCQYLSQVDKPTKKYGVKLTAFFKDVISLESSEFNGFAEMDAEGLADWLRPRLEDLKFCPICLEENGMHQNLWGYPFIEACANHHCALIAACPACGSNYTWTKPGVNWTCLCGQPITETVPVKAKPNDLAVARFLVNALSQDLPAKQRQTLVPLPVHCQTLLLACETLRWASHLKNAFYYKKRNSSYKFDYEQTSTFMALPKATLGWGVRLLETGQDDLYRRFVRAMRFSYQRTGFLLEEKNDVEMLMNCRSFLSESSENPYQARLMNVLQRYVLDYGWPLPVYGRTVLYDPRYSKAEIQAVITGFGPWWQKVAASMKEVDASTRQLMALHPKNSFWKFGNPDAVFKILHMLLQASHEGYEPKDFHALSHWWRIEESMRDPQPPEDALNQLGRYLLTLPVIEVKLVFDLVLLSYSSPGRT